MRRSVASWRGFKAGVACLAVTAVQTAWATEHERDGAHVSDPAQPWVREAARDAVKALDLGQRAVDVRDPDDAFASSGIRHIDLGVQTSVHGLDDLDLGLHAAHGLGTASDRARDVGIAIQSPGEPFAQQVRGMRRDGLPLVHLWRGAHGALSLGLNARGKPGLWLVEKVR